jgi:2-amino-4-hydroxy-6-hydroxymethyldihydropteridine diphosphokinase
MLGEKMLDPRTLLAKLQQIEQDQGRVRDGEHWGPRTLDLDLLMHGSTVIDEPGLTLPHPGIALRNFVLLPLAEIASDVVVPELTDVATLVQRIGTSNPAIEKLAL